MLVSEIESDKTVTIEVIQKSNKITFESKSVQVLDDALLIESVKHDNQVVNMKSDNISISVTVNVEPLPVQFSDVDIDTVLYHDEVYHLVKSQFHGKQVNRRENYRVYIGVDGSAQIEGYDANQDVIVKDVSIGGFALITDVDIDAEGATVRLYYLDEGTKIVLNGKIVRKEQMEKNRYLYGCELLNVPNGLGKYLNDKQVKKNC